MSGERSCADIMKGESGHESGRVNNDVRLMLPEL